MATEMKGGNADFRAMPLHPTETIVFNECPSHCRGGRIHFASPYIWNSWSSLRTSARSLRVEAKTCSLQRVGLVPPFSTPPSGYSK